MGKTASEGLTATVAVLDELEDGDRQRVLTALLTFYGSTQGPRLQIRPRDASPTLGEPPPPDARLPFVGDELDPKEFLKKKRPATAVERIACLAYYLAKYRDQPFFKTQDLSRLNAEAAQPKFGNASQAAANALKLGYLAQGSKGQRQISAFGEEFVTALPDKEAAKEVSKHLRPPAKRKRRKRQSADGDSVTSPANGSEP